MKRTSLQFLLAFLLTMTTWLSAGDKSKYDLAGPEEFSGNSLAKTTSLTSDRWMISRATAAATMLEGGYFTIGTTAGLSQLALDDNCGVTFGHPYAKTSYPLLHIDGVWGKPDRFFQTTATYPSVSGDSLILAYTAAGKYSMRFIMVLENGGAKIRLISELKNTDATAHTFGLGLVFDPALGRSGDGSVTVGSTAILRDTLLASTSLDAKSITVSERLSSVYGMKIGIAYPSASPTTFIVANWDDAVTGDSPSFTPSDVRRLYDAVIKMFWAPRSVAAATTLTQETVVSLVQPNFGTGVFLRWDVPGTQSVENGIPFPSQFTSHVSATNVTASAKNAVQLSLSPTVDIQSAAVASSAVNAQSTTYTKLPLTVKELYENKVVDLVLLCKENNIVIDSLVHPFRICSAPVSDTGLTVHFDSLMTAAFPKVRFTFDVVKKSTLQNVFALTADNLFCYENGVRITDFTVGKDTTGGAGAVDIVFVLDVTGSMSGSITGVKNNIMEFADSLAARGVNYRLGMVTFLDVIENVYDFTTDAQKFKASVALQYAHGGDDAPENSLDALYRASEMQFRETAKKVFIWITDITYHEKDQFTTRVRQDVINRLLSLDVTVHAIGALPYQTDWYNPFTQATGGNYYNINGNFRDILLDIGNLRGTNRYLFSYTSPASSSQTKQLTLTVHYAGLGGTGTTSYSSPSTNTVASAFGCFPNPFNPQTTIRMQIPEGTHGAVTIYNVLGQQIRTFRLAGTGGMTEAVWNAKDDQGRDVAAGFYVVRFMLYSMADRLLSAETAKLLYVK